MTSGINSIPLEDYGLIADTHSAGLVSSGGSIDWLCLPRFDSGSCFTALLDQQKGGRWSLRPKDTSFQSESAYRPESMVLETVFTTESGSVKVTDCLALEEASDPAHPRQIHPWEAIVRVVEPISGEVPMQMEFTPRFDYGHVLPWLRRLGETVQAVGGPDALDLCADVPLELEKSVVRATFTVAEGEKARFVATYHPSHVEATPHPASEADQFTASTDEFWRSWAARCTYQGQWRPQVIRSLLTLKALTYSPTGGVVAAPTTSLPEELGGVRNWDYRYCWLRDATFTLDALLEHGYTEESEEWIDWLLRAVAGDPQDIQIMYGVNGERRLIEYQLDWLCGYEDSRPVRVGNAAVDQFQLDVYGETMDVFHTARRVGIEIPSEAWELQEQMTEFVCEHWQEPDEGIWEVRSGPEHFVHSKVMAWVAVDRAIKAVESFGRTGPLDHWKQVRQSIRNEVLERGYDTELGHFVRAYGGDALDAALLMLPLVGFIPAKDPRMSGTIEAIERELSEDGLLLRYRTKGEVDGLPGREGTFIMCSFWLVDCLVLLGRQDDAEKLFRRLLSLSNRLDLLAEQYDTRCGRMVGNFPQAFSHVALVNSAIILEKAGKALAATRGQDPAVREGSADPG